MRPASPPAPSTLVAELGPTNTGKTHRAIERMLEHDSGMIGLPLRLLAREVYDRVSAKVGEGRVAVDELAQIAGRAGRHLNDGAFGTLGSAPELDPRTISAIEEHRFPAVQRLVWRSSELDYTSPEALLDSLALPAESSLFARVERANDFDALRELSQLPLVRERVRDPAAVALLWEVCRIPDFRKRLFGEHVLLLEDTFLQLIAGDGLLQPEWLSRQIAPLDDFSGDIHVLTDRLAAIRIWTYISQRPHWVPDSRAWQERTRRIEDALGDALHARLVERFVERAERRAPRRFKRPTTPLHDGPFAKLGELAGLDVTEDDVVQQLVDATHDAFAVDSSGRILFDGDPIARLLRGPDRLSPNVALLDGDEWTGGARRRLERRMAAFAKDLVAEAMGGFPAEALSAEGRSAPLRAIAYRFAQGMGVARRDAPLLEQCRLLDAESRERLDALGVREGQRFLIVANAVTPQALERRCLLTALFEGEPRPQGAPTEPVLRREVMTGRSAEQYGYEWLGPVAVRIDALERLIPALSDPRFNEQRDALMTELRLDQATRAAVLRELLPREHSAPKRSNRPRRGPS